MHAFLGGGRTLALTTLPEDQIDPGPGLAAWSDSLFTLTPAQHEQGDFLSLYLPHPQGPSFRFNGLTQDFQNSTQRLLSPEFLPLRKEPGTLRSLLGDKLGSFEDGRGWFCLWRHRHSGV